MRSIDLQVLFEDTIGPLMTNYTKTFSSSEIERLLNAAQNQYVVALADKFEYNERARRALERLIKGTKTYAILPHPIDVSPISNYSSFYKPNLDNIMRIVEEQLVNGNTRIRIRPITHDQFLVNINNPYKKPYKDLAWRFDTNEYIELVTDPSVYSDIGNYGYEIRYLEYPKKIDIQDTNELSLHDDDLKNIVKIAVDEALRSLSVVSKKGA